MEITNPLPIETREEWRAWLAKNGTTEKFCWLPVTRGMWGANGTKGIPYLDAVEEALCFGWIDSTSKQGHQRFSPRNKKGNWTELNKARVERLERLGLMTDEGRNVVPAEPFIIHPDIDKALKQDPEVYKHFLSFPEIYRRVRIDNIQVWLKRKEPELYQKRLEKFIENTKTGKMFGDWHDGGRLLE